MRPIEIKDLVVGLTAIVLLAVAVGQLDQLYGYARKEAIQALKGWPSHAFFPGGYDATSRKSKGVAHAKK